MVKQDAAAHVDDFDVCCLTSLVSTVIHQCPVRCESIERLQGRSRASLTVSTKHEGDNYLLAENQTTDGDPFPRSKSTQEAKAASRRHSYPQLVNGAMGVEFSSSDYVSAFLTTSCTETKTERCEVERDPTACRCAPEEEATYGSTSSSGRGAASSGRRCR